MEFKSPYLLLLIPLAAVILYLMRLRRKEASFFFPSTGILKEAPAGWKVRCWRAPFYFKCLALILVIIALAGPRKVLEQTLVSSEGVDIVLALDISGSMAAEDFVINGQRKNRLEIVKTAVKEFIDERKSDRIGLVVFGARAYTACPLTTDHGWLKENLNRVRLGAVEDGTAIGSGLASSLLRLKSGEAKSKIVVLLTDGANNAGRISPLAAAEIARQMKVKVYTIGAGTNGYAPMPVNMFGRVVYQQVEVNIEEEPLRQIAQITDGQYFRATDTQGLREIYKRIDALEKSKIETRGYRQYQELFWILAVSALIIWMLSLVLESTVFLKIP